MHHCVKLTRGGTALALSKSQSLEPVPGICIFSHMSQTRYAKILQDIQEELMTAATQHAVAWRFGNWTARQRLLHVHEGLLRHVRKTLVQLNHQVLAETPEFRKEFGAEFQRWAHQLPEPAKEQLELLKTYTKVLVDPKTQ